jgi:hypothetical protein
MYDKLDLTEIKKCAEMFVLENDRLLYKPYFEEVEKYVSANNLLFGGKICSDILTQRPMTKDSFEWELYSENARMHASKLAEAFVTVPTHIIDSRLTKLETPVPNEEFELSVNARLLVRIYRIDKYRGQSLQSIIAPIKMPAIFTGVSIGCMPADMQILEVYRALYSPVKVAQWPALLEMEKNLFALIPKRGGQLQQFNLEANVKSMIGTLLDSYFPGADEILIGEYAMAALGVSTGRPQRLQFISSVNIKDLCTSFERLLRDNGGAEYRIKSEKLIISIPTDFRIEKHIIYLMRGGQQYPVADVFNSTTYEMIPFYYGAGSDYTNIKAANPFVILRFLFLDMWILKIIRLLKSGISIESRMAILYTNCVKMREYAVTLPEDKLFSLTDYGGVYTDEIVARKKKAFSMDRRIPPYFPAKKTDADDRIDGGAESADDWEV